MEIKCSIHPDAQANMICDQCGFLCQIDKNNEKCKTHKREDILTEHRTQYSCLAGEMALQKLIRQLIIAKYSINCLFDSEINAKQISMSELCAQIKDYGKLPNNILQFKALLYSNEYYNFSAIQCSINALSLVKTKINEIIEAQTFSLEQLTTTSISDTPTPIAIHPTNTNEIDAQSTCCNDLAILANIPTQDQNQIECMLTPDSQQLINPIPMPIMEEDKLDITDEQCNYVI